MCADIFCGWNLFGHQVFLPAIAIMSSQQIRILQSSNLYWCRNSHIHEGILVCPARHPLLHAAIDKVMETRPSSLRSRQPEYMTFYRQMWKLLQSRSEGKLQIGQNALGNWGSVCLLQGQKAKHRCQQICNESIQNDGYLAYMKHWNRPVVAIRCENWKHGFKGVQKNESNGCHCKDEYFSTNS